MENRDDLHIEIIALRPIRIGIGIVTIIGAIALFIAKINDFNPIYYIILPSFLLIGLAHLTNDFGMNKMFVKSDESGLQIRWNSMRTRIVPLEEIDNISYSRYYVTINRVNDRPVMLGLRNFEVSQKTRAYQFFKEFAEKNKILITHL